ncbi:asparagine synthetase B family protein [Nocardiopsis sediminis]|uniref:asparagine synthase (glutamine-hydrolyzing) n=1 Tax=Nocardiopsis sediminis TaxID=1778267 RepID=A0ABV8FSP4_9ACTN
MSGVVGWIDFERDLVRDRPVLMALTGTLAQRGPDQESVWVSRYAALGYRGLDAPPVSGGQPFVVEIGDAPVAACVTGTPAGLEDLRTRLRAAGCAHAARAGAAELVVRGYLEWGEDVVPRLTGAFALAIWDGRTGELVLARDRMGGQTLFYAAGRSGVVFASERKALLMHPETASVVDINGLREVVAHALPPGPIFHGLSQVESAEIARFGRSGWTRRRYWRLEPRPHTDDVEATVATVRAMLEEGVRAAVPEDTSQVAATLSGGIDSSAVAALVAAEMRRHGRDRLRTFTVDFGGEAFRRGAVHDTRDEPYARAVAEHIDATYNLVELDPADILDPVVRTGIMRAKDCPTRIYDMDASQYLFLQHVAAQGAKVVFTGGMGDQLFHGARWSTDRELVQSGTFPWIALAQRHGSVNGFGTRLLDAGVLAALDLPTYYRDAYASAVAEVEYLPEDDDWQRLMRQVSHLLLTRFRTDSGLFNAVGLQLRAPINNHRLIEYAYNIPARMQTHGGIEKGLLRAAVADTLPEQVVRRPQSATPVSASPAYAQRLHQEFTAVLADRQAPVHPLIDLPAAAKIADDPASLIGDRLTRADVDLVLQLNLWLDCYRVRLAL